MNKDFGMDIHQMPMIPTPPLPAARPRPVIGLQRGGKFEGPSTSDVSKMIEGAKKTQNARRVTVSEHRSVSSTKTFIEKPDVKSAQSGEVKSERLGSPSESKEAHKTVAEDGLLAMRLLKDFQQTGDIGDRKILGVQYRDIKITRKGDDIDGFTTYEFKIQDAKTGQLQSFKVSNFEKGAYRGPRVEDFVDRLDLAAKALIKYGVGPEDMKEIENARKNLEKLTFNTDDMKSPDTAMDAYKKMDKAANEIIEQCIADIGTSHKKRSGSFSAKEVALFERDVIREINKTRPIVVNQYTMTKNGQTKTFANIQIPQTMKEENGKRVPGETIPTNKRDGLGLVNYCSSSLVEVNESGKATLLVDACRFSSLPPIAVKDSEIRQAMACENARQFIEDRAADLLSSVAEEDRGKTITLPINYMMLVTAFKGDDLRNKKLGVAGAWKGESEKLQLEETAFALQMFEGREIEVTIDGKTYKFMPDIMFMNLGANAAATTEVKAIVMVDIQQGINARGFDKFQNKFKSFQEDAINDLPDDMRGQLDAFKANSAKREQLLKTSEIPKADFSSKYEALEKKQRTLLVDKDNKELRREVKQMQKELASLEKRENEKFASHEARQRKEYLEHKDEIQKCEAEMIKNLDECLNSPEISGEDKKKLLALKNAVRSAHNASNLYYSKSYEKIETVMETQSAILEALHFMDEFIAFGCKSGKDRTGGQDNLIQSHFIYMAFNNGNIPVSREEREKCLESTKDINQYSASLDNTKFNVGLGGLLVSDEAVRGLFGDAKIGKKHVNSAKSTYAGVEERMKVSKTEKATQRALRTISSAGRKEIKNEVRRRIST